MMTLQTIRDALRAPDPYTRMDELVRLELQAGLRVKDVFDAVNPLVDLILETPGLTDDGEEAFLGALDALIGNCRADQCYKDVSSPPVDPSNENRPFIHAS